MADGARGGLNVAYLVVGPDELKRQAAVKRLRARLDPSLLDFNFDEFRGRECDDGAALVNSLQTMPFGCDFRLVLVYGAESMPKAASEAVVDYLAGVAGAQNGVGSVLCLVAERLAKNTRMYKTVAKSGPRSVIECGALKRGELPAYVARLAASHGKALGPGAAEELVARAGESTTMLDNQVATLAALVGEASQITRADVAAHVAQTAEVKPWTLLDAACQRDAGRTMELFAQMGSVPAPLLISQIVNRLRELICAKAVGERRGGSVAAELGKKDWQVRNYSRWARSFTMEELVGDLRLAADCERVVKGAGDERQALAALLLAIASPGAPRAVCG